MKNTKDRRIWRSRALAILLLAPLAFSSCENRHPEMDITMGTDFSEIIAAINSANKSLSDKLALIEASLQQGLADNQAAMEQVRLAVASLSGTMEEKLAVVEAAVKAQTTSLETKLGGGQQRLCRQPGATGAAATGHRFAERFDGGANRSDRNDRESPDIEPGNEDRPD